MSLSVRSQILKNIKNLINSINFGETVKVLFISPENLELKDIPAVTVELINEQSDYTTIGINREIQKVLNIDVSGVVKSRTDLFLKADELITKIEETFGNNPKLNSLNGIVLTSEISSLEYRDYNDLIESCGGFTITLTISYYVQENNLRETI